MQPRVVAPTVIAILLLAACDAAPDASKVLDPSGLGLRAETITNKTSEKNVPWTTFETNPCNGDEVAVTGNSNVKMTTVLKDDGSFKLTSNLVSKGTGIGTAPGFKAYKVDEHFKFAEQVSDPDSEGMVIKSTDKWDVDGPTSADSYKRYVVFKFIVEPDGETKVFIDTSYAKCEQ